MEMPAHGDAAFRATIRFASAPTIRCCAAVGGSAALRMRHTPCGCRSAHLVEVQTNLLLPTMHTVSIMRTAASEAMPHSASCLPPSKRHSRLTTVRRGCCQVATRRDSWRSHVHRTQLRSACSHSSYKLPMPGVEGPPLAFLWGIQRGYSLRKENTPFGVAARTPLSLPRLRGKRCSPFGYPSLRAARGKYLRPCGRKKRAPLRVLFFKSLRISRTGTSGRLRR